MLEQVLSMRFVLITLFGQVEKNCPLDSHGWDVLTDLVNLLEPIEVTSKILEGEKSCHVSELIPAVRGLRNEFINSFVEMNPNRNQRYLKTIEGRDFKIELMKHLNIRFDKYMSLPNSTRIDIVNNTMALNDTTIPYIAMALDHRYKACLILDEQEKVAVSLILYRFIEWKNRTDVEPVIDRRERILRPVVNSSYSNMKFTNF